MTKLNERIAKKLNKIIRKWQGKGKLVVAIDGYTGVGKTTLLNNLAKLNSDILPVNRDDFQISRTKFKKLYKNAKNRMQTFELAMNDSAKLKKLVQIFRKSNKSYKIKAYDGVSGKINIPKTYDFSKRIMVIEGVFMFHPKLLGKLWDKRIYLKGDIKQIDKRRIAREKKRWGKDYFPETHPDSYFRQVIIALKRYQELYQPEKAANLVLKV
ncbi:MAG: P-loop NTPase fold protein [bacterium]|nr:P-loop NTPase fold protein [bacterium]